MSGALWVPATNWAMVGRWFGNMAHGQFVQVATSEAAPFKGELAIGWIAHYAIGICYGLLLLALCGKVWLERPTLLPPMILAWVLLVAPYLIMDAGDGNGHCGVTNAQTKHHAAERRDGPFGLRPWHVRDRMATRLVLADFGVRPRPANLIRSDAFRPVRTLGLRVADVIVGK